MDTPDSINRCTECQKPVESTLCCAECSAPICEDCIEDGNCVNCNEQLTDDNEDEEDDD